MMYHIIWYIFMFEYVYTGYYVIKIYWIEIVLYISIMLLVYSIHKGSIWILIGILKYDNRSIWFFQDIRIIVSSENLQQNQHKVLQLETISNFFSYSFITFFRSYYNVLSYRSINMRGMLSWDNHFTTVFPYDIYDILFHLESRMNFLKSRYNLCDIG